MIIGGSSGWSYASLAMAGRQGRPQQDGDPSSAVAGERPSPERGRGPESAGRVGSPDERPPEESREIDQLREVDRKVRAHEQAHMAAAGGMVRGVSYEYQTGPDQKRYVVAGEVSIDTSAGRTPEETLAKAQRIRSAAMAPADPSPQDRSVAAQAGQMEAQARQEMAQRSREGGQDNGAAAGDGQSSRVGASSAISAYSRQSGQGAAGSSGFYVQA